MSRGSDTRERIMEEARGLFAAQGYAATSIAEIASATGVSEGAIYRHFDSKRELLKECVWPALDEALRVLSVDSPEITDLKSFIRVRLQQRLDLFHKHYEAFQIFFTEAYLRTDLFQEFFDSMFEYWQAHAAAKQMLQFQELRRWRNLLVIAMGQMLALWGVFHLRHLAHSLSGQLPEALSQVSDEHLVEDFTDFFLYGLVGVPPEEVDIPGGEKPG